jgi:2-keto-4-pentenoate hydratase/2-oxohepta-3-ene-1,7-dioic acid hydratase in catechol pathway
VRIGTVRHEGRDRPAVLDGDGAVRLAEGVPDALAMIEAWPVGPRLGPTLDPAELVMRPPVRPRKLICVGTNYRDHVAEMQESTGVVLREEPFPFGFLKPATALAGSGEPVRRPGHGTKLDFEAELAIVIGDAAAATTAEPLRAVFGYTILNDLSLRDFLPFPHALGLDAVVGKGWDGAAPLGPWITPVAEAGDPQDLPVRLTLNGELMQDSSTAQMIFGVAEIVAHYLRVLTLEPGDVIATGTPAGVGAARRPPRFLAAGDVVEATVGELGRLVTPIV